MPSPVRIKNIEIATEDRTVRTFELEFLNSQDAANFKYLPGQFAELSVHGYGESPIGMASSPTEGDTLLFTVSLAGVVTTQLHNMREGEIIGVRGPLGNSYPLEYMQGKNVVILAGGYAVTTLRATMVWLLPPDNWDKFKDITFIYGSRTPGMLLYKDTLEEWNKRSDVNTYITIDKHVEGWDKYVGFVPQIAEEVSPSPENSVALVCGPPVMIKFTQPVLDKCGWQSDQIIMSLENRMKCGLDICGRCNVGPYYVCKDGPVFSKAQLDELPREY